MCGSVLCGSGGAGGGGDLEVAASGIWVRNGGHAPAVAVDDAVVVAAQQDEVGPPGGAASDAGRRVVLPGSLGGCSSIE